MQIASLAAASAPGLQACSEALQKACKNLSKPSYKVQLMWMHRLPAYRTRLQQILSSSLAGQKAGFLSLSLHRILWKTPFCSILVYKFPYTPANMIQAWFVQAAGDKRPRQDSRQALELSRSIFPTITINRGSYCHLSPCFGLDDSLLFASSRRPQALHWRKLLASLPAIKQLRHALSMRATRMPHSTQWSFGAK